MQVRVQKQVTGLGGEKHPSVFRYSHYKQAIVVGYRTGRRTNNRGDVGLQAMQTLDLRVPVNGLKTTMTLSQWEKTHVTL